MTSEYERGHAAGREAGIREAVAVFDDLWRENTGYTRAQMIALLDSPPAPAGVTVQDLQPLTDDEKARLRNFAREMDIRNAARVLLGVVERREWTHYPIEMPLNANMKGPAKVGKDAHCMTYEVWEADTFRSISDHNKLPDAVESWLRALSEGRT